LGSACSDSEYWQKLFDLTEGSASIPPYNERHANCCHIFTKSLIHDNLQNFAEMMKQSMVKNAKIKASPESLFINDTAFYEKFLARAKFLKAFNLTLAPGETLFLSLKN
jgi:hypothetical protein